MSLYYKNLKQTGKHSLITDPDTFLIQGLPFMASLTLFAIPKVIFTLSFPQELLAEFLVMLVLAGKANFCTVAFTLVKK